MKIAAALLLFFGLVGCAATPATDNDGAAESGQAESSGTGVATAFAIDYGASGSAAGILVQSGSFDTIDDVALTDTLPDGDARAAAKCLAARHDSIHGDSLAGLTWTYQDQTYYVLVVALDDMQGLTDLHLLFVYGADGTAAFEALTWDGKKNVKITSGRSAC